MPRLKECINCRSLIPNQTNRLDNRGTLERLCKPCRNEVSIREKARRGALLLPLRAECDGS